MKKETIEGFRDGHNAYMRDYRNRCIAKGQCVSCSGEALPGKRKCKACSDKWNANRNARRRELKNGSLCTECGKPVWAGHSACRCEECFKANKQCCIDRRAAFVAAGLCGRCGLNPLSSPTQCETCCLKYNAHSLWRDRSRWQELKELFDRQQGKCPYSGLPMTVGINATIDHIIPRSKGGSNDLANLQWVDATVNVMKTDQSEGDFLSMIARIALFSKARLRIAG